MKRFFWIYYGIAILVNVIAVIVFHENIHISWHSLFPIGYISLMLFYGFFAPSKKAAEVLAQSYENDRIKWGYPLDDPPLPSAEELWKATIKTTTTSSRIFFSFVPPIFFFICFFSNLAKILSILFLASAVIVYLLYLICSLNENIKTHNLELQKKRKEQEEKESQGKWK
jgi:amino acid permease